MAKLPEKSLVMTDSGFGIFGVAHEAPLHDATHGSQKRFARRPPWFLKAHTTRRTRKWVRRPVILLSTSLEVTHPALTLYLVTHADTLAGLFKFPGRFGNLKVVMDTENIRAKSVDMFTKELFTSVVAYNLVGQFRRQAAEINKMSFKKTRPSRRFCSVIYIRREAYQPLIKDKLPNRPGRTAKREAYKKRPKD